MKTTEVNTLQLVDKARGLIDQESAHLSNDLRTSLDVILTLVVDLANKLALNSRNSSKPPSSDPHRKKGAKSAEKRKPGGQLGHKGAQLQPVAKPDHIEVIACDRSQLPEGDYVADGYVSRQVFDLKVTRVVTEYRAEALIGPDGCRHVANFPEGVTQAAQYGRGVKS